MVLPKRLIGAVTAALCAFTVSVSHAADSDIPKSFTGEHERVAHYTGGHR